MVVVGRRMEMDTEQMITAFLGLSRAYLGVEGCGPVVFESSVQLFWVVSKRGEGWSGDVSVNFNL